jgi:hypothetical protein
VFAVLVKGCGIGVAVHFVERVLGPRFELQGVMIIRRCGVEIKKVGDVMKGLSYL